MDLNRILVFARVVQAGSFVGAARVLGMPKSTVSRKVSELEAELGARLLHRTTRSLHLTDVGETFYRYAARAVAEAEAAELAVGRLQEVPRGPLRVTVPLNFGFLGPIVASFLTRYPEVQLELVCADRVVDLVQEGFDVAIRAGNLADSTLVARPLGTLESHLVASPDFLTRQGMPTHPRDLEGFDCIAFGGGGSRARWRLQRADENTTVEVDARLAVNDFDFLDQAVLAGLGIAMVPLFRCEAHLRAGRLRRALAEWCSPPLPLHAVYPSARHLSPKVVGFVDHVRAHMSPPPWEAGA